jgi:DNA-binding MarR family transcriptional regulator
VQAGGEHVDDGLVRVERVTAPGDGRGVHVRLTADGRRLAERLTEQGEGALSGLLDVLAAGARARLGSLAGTVVRAHAAGRGVDLGWA